MNRVATTSHARRWSCAIAGTSACRQRTLVQPIGDCQPAVLRAGAAAAPGLPTSARSVTAPDVDHVEQFAPGNETAQILGEHAAAILLVADAGPRAVGRED